MSNTITKYYEDITNFQKFSRFQGIKQSIDTNPSIRYTGHMDILSILGIILLGILTAAVFFMNNH